jgi:hypothetical protein
MGEVAFVFEMLHPHSPTSVEVRVAAPTGQRLHPLVRRLPPRRPQADTCESVRRVARRQGRW